MKTKHTPGPWYPVEFSGYWTVRDDRFYESRDLLNEEDCSRAEANAKLIATAPELLEALVCARKMMLKSGITVDNADQYNLIDNAIKKAVE